METKPSDIYLSPIPLTATLGKSEAEWAAALLIRVCQVDGDRWQPVRAPRAGEVLSADCEAGTKPFAELFKNPFFQPDFWALVDRGFATWDGEPGKSALSLTPTAIERIAAKWAMQPKTKMPSGTPVVVTLDDGTKWETTTRSEPWQLGHGDWVVLLTGKTGGYALDRVERAP